MSYTPFKMKGMPMIQGSNSHKQAVEGSSPAKQDWSKYLNPVTAARKAADLIKGTEKPKSKASQPKNKGKKMTKEETQKMADKTMNPKKTFSDSIPKEQRDKADKQYVKKWEDHHFSQKTIGELDKEKKEKKKVTTKVKKKKILDLTPTSKKD